MGNIRIRKTGDSKSDSGIKFRRKLNIEWNSKNLESENDVNGNEGTLDRAIIFANLKTNVTDPSTLLIDKVEFSSFKEKNIKALRSSTGNTHKITDGPFFRSNSNFQKDLNKLSTLGGWVSNLPKDENLILRIDSLKADVIYEIRLIFSRGKKGCSENITLNSGDCTLDLSIEENQVAIGRFIAPSEAIELTIGSSDNNPPFINALVVRQIGFSPRMSMIVSLIA